jgi:hypothetical protein
MADFKNALRVKGSTERLIIFLHISLCPMLAAIDITGAQL